MGVVCLCVCKSAFGCESVHVWLMREHVVVGDRYVCEYVVHVGGECTCMVRVCIVCMCVVGEW